MIILLLAISIGKLLTVWLDHIPPETHKSSANN